jgi:hypothetical protein
MTTTPDPKYKISDLVRFIHEFDRAHGSHSRGAQLRWFNNQIHEHFPGIADEQVQEAVTIARNEKQAIARGEDVTL